MINPVSYLNYNLFVRRKGENLPVSRIGTIAGLPGFALTIRRHQESGWNGPPPLLIYRGKEKDRKGSQPAKAEGTMASECRVGSNIALHWT